MSYILNALRKSERERQAVEPDAITNRIAIDQSPRHHNSAIVVLTLIVINVAILTYFLGFTEKEKANEPELVTRKTSESLPVENKPLPVATDQPQVMTPSTAPEPIQKDEVGLVKPTTVNKAVELKKSNHAGKAVSPVVPPVSIPAISKKEKPIDIPPAVAKPIVSDIPIATVIDSNHENLPKLLDQHEETLAKPDDNPIMEVAPKRNEEPKPSPPAGLPFLDELPYEFQRELPAFVINVYSYSPVATERFVMIDMVKYVPGQQIKDLLEIKEIRSDGIVVNYKGRAFIIRRP